MKTNNGILTVGQLKAILANLDDETHIIIEVDTPYELANVISYELPNETNLALSLVTADTFDARQF